MPKGKRKEVTDLQTPTEVPAETLPAEEPIRGNAFEDPATSTNSSVIVAQPESSPHNGGELSAPVERTLPSAPSSAHHGDEKTFESRIDPRGVHRINLEDGRHLRFLRSDSKQQNRIMFLADNDSIDPKPSREDIDFLKSRQFTWRSADMAWERQFFSKEQKAEIEAARESDGEAGVRQLRSKFRQVSDRIAQDTFVELANRIRTRGGHAPLGYTFAEPQRER